MKCEHCHATRADQPGVAEVMMAVIWIASPLGPSATGLRLLLPPRTSPTVVLESVRHFACVNPLHMDTLIGQISDAVHNTRDRAGSLTARAKALVGEKQLGERYVDLTIQFIGASGIPKMDVVGLSDPYFVAKLDDQITFISTVQPHTLSPVWNEVWQVKNVPSSAILHVDVLDKDDGAPTDDYIGRFQTTLTPGAKEAEIEGPLFKRARGSFWLKIESKPSVNDPQAATYVFDGPIRYSRHFSPIVGRLTNINDQRPYSTWKMYIKGVKLFFGDRTQHWNVDYRAAQQIFQGPASIAVRSGIQAGHRMLYARSTTNGFGIINGPADVLALLHSGPHRSDDPNAQADASVNRVKPAVYTYIIAVEDDTFRFSETGAPFFVDFASKHALHSNCAQAVRYSGEFHPRPAGGWEHFDDSIPDDQVQWELVIDNNSGTYAPDKALLPDLKALLEYNFPGFNVITLDREDPELEKSREACRRYAVEHRGVKSEELQPHVNEGVEPLSHHPSVKATEATEASA